jgi:hypothetical protein
MRDIERVPTTGEPPRRSADQRPPRPARRPEKDRASRRDGSEGNAPLTKQPEPSSVVDVRV